MLRYQQVDPVLWTIYFRDTENRSPLTSHRGAIFRVTQRSRERQPPFLAGLSKDVLQMNCRDLSRCAETVSPSRAQTPHDRTMSHSASAYSLSRELCLPFQPHGLPRLIDQHDEDGVIQCFSTDAIQFEEVKASQSNRSDSFKLSLCVNVLLMVM
jgi:hypothetical protein